MNLIESLSLDGESNGSFYRTELPTVLLSLLRML